MLGEPSRNRNLDNVANGSYGLYLLGVVFERQARYNEAKDCYQKALDLNPNMWAAYERCGRLGDIANPIKIFTETKLKNFEGSSARKQGATPVSKKKKEEDDRLKRLAQGQFPKRKNSMHNDTSSINHFK